MSATLDLGTLSYTLKVNGDGFSRSIKEAQENMTGLENGVKSANEVNKNFESNMKSFQNSLKETGTNFENLDSKLKLWVASNKNSVGAIEINNKAIETNKAKMAELGSQIVKSNAVLKETKAAFGEDSEAYKKVENSVLQLELSYKKLEEENKKLIISNKEIQESENTSAFQRLSESINKNSDSTSKLDKSSKSLVTSLRGTISSALLAGTVFTGSAAGAFKLADSASNLSEAQNVVEQTFKTSAGSIEDWSKTTAKSAGISQTASTQWAGFMGAMLKSSGVTENSAANMSKSLVQLTGDMSSFYNVSTDEMWEKIRSGISGETEPLKQLGINMDVANLKAFALSQGIKKPYEAMSQGEQTQLRYNYLMNVTKDAQGDFARTLGTSFANQVRVAQMNLASLGQSIGAIILPAFNKLVTGFNSVMPSIQNAIKSASNFISDAFKKLSPIILGIGQDVLKIATSIFPQLNSSSSNLGKTLLGVAQGGLGALKTAFDWMAQHGTIVGTVIAGITGAFVAYKATVLAVNAVEEINNALIAVSAIRQGVACVALDAMQNSTKSATVAQWLLNAALDANPIGIVVVAIGALVAGLIYAYKHSETFRNIVNGAFNSIKNVAVSVFNFLKDFISKWGTTILVAVVPFIGIPVLIVQHWGQIKEFFSKLWSDIKTGLSSAWNGIVSTLTNIWKKIETAASSAWHGIVSVINPIVQFFANGITNIWRNMSTGVTNVLKGLKTTIKGIWEAIKTIVMAPVLIILDLVTGNFKKLSSDVKLIFTDLQKSFSNIWNGIGSIFTGGIQAISGFCIGAFQNLSSSAQAIWNALSTFLSGLWNGIVNTAQSVWNGLVSFLNNLWNSTINTAQSLWNGFRNFFQNLWAGIVNIIQGIPTAFQNVGNAIVSAWNAVVNFFESLPGRFVGFVGGIGNAIVHGFDSAINFITSLPGKALEWGKDFIDGLINGITGGIGKIGDAVSGVADKIRSFLHFSVPDEGPLVDYETWMPDFMKGLANGINKNKSMVANAIKGMASDMKLGLKINPETIGAVQKNPPIGKQTNKANSGIALNFNNVTINGYTDLKKVMRDAYNINQDYQRGKGIN
ncbi:hypothetical protein NL50_17250 [Clostridium acetobutylicum]|nr:hypothetical protein NL50_17250 [Clostridium acetobutylicum]